MPLPYPPPIMDIETLSQHICLSPDQIEAKVKLGELPPPITKPGDKRRWLWDEVLKAHKKLRAEPQDDLADRVRAGTKALLAKNSSS
jgi:hypothetical protein